MLTSASRFVIKRNFWSVLERTFRVFTADGQMIMFVKRPLMRLREEFVVSADESELQPLLRIRSRQMVAINHVFEITDANSGARVGSVQKHGMRSVLRDRFTILDANDFEIGYMEEQGAALLRRFFPFLTSEHSIVIGDREVAHIHQRFRFVTKEFDVDIVSDGVDRRFVLACALLALMAEARREDRR